MIKLPKLKFSSNKKLHAIFRKPDVADTLEFSNANPNFEEKLATEYLNSLIVETNHDTNSATWSPEDRAVALWWIFINIMPDSLLAYEYKCRHCNEKHVADVDLRDLDKEIILVDELPLISTSLRFDGRKRIVEVNSGCGAAMEKLEELRLGLDDLKGNDLANRKSEIRLTEFAYRIKFDDEPCDFEDAFEHRVKLIQKMAFDEFTKLAWEIKQANEKLRHGLHSETIDGKMYLVSPPLECEQKEDASATTRLRMRFRSSYFIPAI